MHISYVPTLSKTLISFYSTTLGTSLKAFKDLTYLGTPITETLKVSIKYFKTLGVA